MSSKCEVCGRNEVEKEGKCAICLVEKYGLPWMAKMVVENSVQTEVAYVKIDKKNYLVVTGSNGMLFTEKEVIKAEDRFRGQVPLQLKLINHSRREKTTKKHLSFNDDQQQIPEVDKMNAEEILDRIMPKEIDTEEKIKEMLE